MGKSNTLSGKQLETLIDQTDSLETLLSLGVPVSANKLDTAPRVGQAKIVVTGTAVQLGTNTLLNGVIITAASANVATITIGTSAVTNTVDGTGNGYILAAGASISFAVNNTNVLYINGTAEDIISFSGS